MKDLAPTASPRRWKAVTVPAALTVSLVVTIVCFVRSAVLALSLPWRYWWVGHPQGHDRACSIDERPRQANGELGIAVADFKITNWSWLDREYAVTLVAKDHAGHIVGAMKSGYLAAIPAKSSMVSRWHTITLTAPGAITCHVGQAKMVTT